MKKSMLKWAIAAMAFAVCAMGCSQPSGGSGATQKGPVKVLPPGTDGTAGTSATYVEFGEWPQTVLPSTSTVTVDKTISKTMGMFTCYKGDDNEWYVECKENACGTGDEYKYTDETQAGQGGTSTRYFKVEPIKWRVLTDNYSGKILLLAENILTANVPYYEYNSQYNTRTVGTDTNIYPNNYMYSQIRAYLNGLDYYYDKSSTEIIAKTDYTGKGFLQTAFTSEAQALIAVTQVDNSLASTGDTANSFVCDPTEDKIFLLSYKEVYKDGYFADNTNRIRKATDYAKANNAYQSSTERCVGDWWLRSPIYKRYWFARVVSKYGSDNDNIVYSFNHGIVPAIAVSF